MRAVLEIDLKDALEQLRPTHARRQRCAQFASHSRGCAIGYPARVREQVTRLVAESGINDVIGAFAGELADVRPASSVAGFLGALSDACGEVNTRERA